MTAPYLVFTRYKSRLLSAFFRRYVRTYELITPEIISRKTNVKNKLIKLVTFFLWRDLCHPASA